MLVDGIVASGRLGKTGLWDGVAEVSTLNKDFWLGCCFCLAALRTSFCSRRTLSETVRPVSMAAMRFTPAMPLDTFLFNIRRRAYKYSNRIPWSSATATVSGISQVLCMCCRNTGISYSFYPRASQWVGHHHPYFSLSSISRIVLGTNDSAGDQFLNSLQRGTNLQLNRCLEWALLVLTAIVILCWAKYNGLLSCNVPFSNVTWPGSFQTERESGCRSTISKL